MGASKYCLIAVCATILNANLACAQVSEASVTAKGTGATQELAVSTALVNAAGQVFGIKIDSQSMLNTTSVKAQSDAEKSSARLSVMNQRISQQVKTPGNSPVLGYSIDQLIQEPTQLFEATVTMRYAKFEKIGGDSSRRSVVVVTNDKKFKEILVGPVSDALTGSRRFDVLNRDNAALFNEEKAFIQGGDAAAAEVARLGQATGADYLVVAELQGLSISNNQRERIEMTGEVLVKSSVSGGLKLQVLEFASRKVKWAASEKFGGTFAGASSISNETLIKLTAGAADKLIEKMVASIYPIRVVKVMGPNTAVINRGEGSVLLGEAYGVFLMGEEMKDPESGESLGEVELDVGNGKIIDVKPKFSYLKMDSVTLDPKAEYIVRRLSATQKGAAAAAASQKPSPPSAKQKETEAKKNFYLNN